MVDLFTAAYIKGEDRDRDASNCDDDHTLSRARKGRSGSRRHWCVRDNSDNLKYREDGGGHNPCRGFDVRFIGGGMDGNGNWRDYPGKSNNYKNAPFALKCQGVYLSDSALRSWSGNDQMLTAGAKDNNGRWKSLYDQTVYGIQTASGRTNGYCADINNLNKVIHNNGSTCFSIIQDEAKKKSEGLRYCQNNPRDPKCKCINVSGSGFIARCKSNSSLPGCGEIIKGLADFQKIGVDTATGLYGNPDCIVPGICSGDVFPPLSPVPPCGNKIAICNQILKMDNITAAAGINSAQHCNINFAAEQKKKDDAAKAAQAAEQKRKDDAAKAAQAAEQKRKDDAAKAAQDAIAKPPTTPSQVAATKSNLPGGISRVQAAVGGGIFSFIILCIFAIILIVVATSGSKRRRR